MQEVFLMDSRITRLQKGIVPISEAHSTGRFSRNVLLESVFANNEAACVCALICTLVLRHLHDI